jgi:two-component system sensor histidine kinase KdpD
VSDTRKPEESKRQMQSGTQWWNLRTLWNNLSKRSSTDHPLDSDHARIPILRRTSGLWAYAQALMIVAVITIFAHGLIPYFAPVNLIMIYLVGVVLAAMWCGRGPAMVASLLSVAAFDFFFVPPFLTFAVSDTQYIITFGVMLLVAVIISSLTVQIKQQAEIAKERERRTAMLYAMSREFATSQQPEALMQIASRHISELFNSDVVMLLPDSQGRLAQAGSLLLDNELGVAQWVYEHGQMAGMGTTRLPAVRGLYVPLITAQGVVGTLGLYPKQPKFAFSADQLQLLETFANQATLAIERARLAEETEQARMQIETEQLRNALLSSVSHDLRTPLAAITGAVSTLLENEQTLDPAARHELAEVAYEESERLNRLLGNLLEMTRLESGGIKVEKEWQLLEEVVGVTLDRLGNRLAGRAFTVNLPDNLPLIPMDSVSIEQVLVNLLENAIKYTPPGSPIELSAQLTTDEVIIEVADRGPGLAIGDEKRVFEKFYRAQPSSAGGVGLGLTICKGIVEAHGGRIWAENRANGGTVFRFTLPLGGKPPEVQSDDE